VRKGGTGADHPRIGAPSGPAERREEGGGARPYVRRLLAVSPGASMASTRAMFGKLVERNPRGFERLFEGLRRCGLREDETS